MLRPVYYLVPLLVFFVLFDFEANFFQLQSAAGERIAQAGLDPRDRAQLSVGIRVSDLLFAATVILCLANVMFGRLPLNVFFNREFVLFLIFAGAGISSLLLGRSDLTSKQVTVAMLYNMKMLEVSLIFPFIIIYNKFRYDDRRVIVSIVYAVLVAGLVGIVANIFPPLSRLVISDRPSYFGPLALCTIFLLHIYLVPDLRHRYALPPLAHLLAVTLGAAAVLLCEKRGIVVGLVAGLGVILWPMLRRAPVLWLLLIPVVGIGVAAFVDRTFFSVEGAVYEGVSPRYATSLKSVPEFAWGFVNELGGLDYSTRERIGKTVFGLFLVADKPWIGFGLNAAPYIRGVGFLPDSMYVALVVESGIVGAALATAFFLALWRRLVPLKKQRLLGGARAIFVAFFAMGLTIQTMNVFSILAIFLALCALSMGWVRAPEPAPPLSTARGRLVIRGIG